MGSYFKPWRRKVGVVTLVMACLLTAGWLRSTSRYEDVTYVLNEGLRESLVSYEGRLSWMRVFYQNAQQSQRAGNRWIFWGSSPISAKSPQSGFMYDLTTWKWEIASIGWREYSDKHLRIVAYSVPYWSIVVPLTLFSAWLLLSKAEAIEAGNPHPRAIKRKRAADRHPNVVATLF